MQAENKERWMAACARIAEEQDRDMLIALVDELNLLLEEEGRDSAFCRVSVLST